MNNKVKFLVVGLCAFGIGMCVNNYAMSDMPSRVAVVDVQKVINASSQFAALKNERQKSTQEVVTFIDNARKDIIATTDPKKKQALEDKYNKELENKKAALNKDYTKKLSALDAKITSIIAAQAKQNNFDVVLNKGAVLYGGTDITDAITKAVK